MNNEAIMKHVCAMVEAYGNATNNSGLLTSMMNDPYKYRECRFLPFLADAAELIISCKESIDRKGAMGNVIPPLKALIKTCQNEHLKGLYTFGGKICFCTGYVAIILPEDVPSLPHVENGPDVLSLFASVDKGVEVQLPAVSDLKAHMAACKTVKRNNAMCLDGNIWINSDWLLRIMQMMPEAKTAYYSGNAKSCLYMTDGKIEALICPVNPATCN